MFIYYYISYIMRQKEIIFSDTNVIIMYVNVCRLELNQEDMFVEFVTYEDEHGF